MRLRADTSLTRQATLGLPAFVMCPATVAAAPSPAVPVATLAYAYAWEQAQRSVVRQANAWLRSPSLN